ncbi:electron transport complex subunit RsxG [Reinekea blandensis]|uniref:Ion-translocating oxidoreductase complex subunit G n=1 Tax=Reinekea blandensis MED297 TaxID=314283 RepID=A4BH72_9GAMM|nr:electron transport complex subunit RsxG [Reinekea blandensis]EAR08571.1 predicted NADH:ubiquinone oxidoreductase, subunit RnfG [Reinekea sp. MED297] [Reinekea blandensis MED297]
MSKTEQPNVTLPEAIRRSAIGLAIFAFFTAGIIAVTQTLTRDTITQNEAAFEARQLLSILPSDYTADDILAGETRFDAQALVGLDRLNLSSDTQHFYRVLTADGQTEAVILPVVAPQGYTEAIRLIVGIKANGQILGVRVTRHKETPGLGDQVETSKSDWIYVFNDRSLMNPQPDDWAVVKDGGAFDQLTGATITPRAIVGAVKNSLLFFEDNQDALLNEPDSVEDGS